MGRLERRIKRGKMENLNLRCSVCGKAVHCSKNGFKSRLNKYSSEEDMEKNYKCRSCIGIARLKNAKEKKDN